MHGACCVARITTRNAAAVSFAKCLSGAHRRIPDVTPGNYDGRSMAVYTRRVNEMNEYEFTLTFILPGTQDDPVQHLDALFEAGCDDAVAGTGTPGTISLEFNRDANSAAKAVDSAIRAVMKAIPGASLVEAKPDLVGLTDVADILNCSRQNIRKYAIGYPDFPRPAVTGKFQLWHLWELAKFDKFSIPETIIEMSKVAWKLNLDLQNRKYKAQLEDSDHKTPLAV